MGRPVPVTVETFAPELQEVIRDLYRRLEVAEEGARGEPGPAGASGHQFYDRGDPASVDFTSFTFDGNWHDLDLSSIVPSGAVLVLLRVTVQGGGGVVSRMQFRENANSNAVNIDSVDAASSETEGPASVLVVPDSSRVVEYRSQGTTPASVDVAVGGWWA